MATGSPKCNVSRALCPFADLPICWGAAKGWGVYTARDMQKYAIWAISAAVAIPVYAVTTLIGLSEVVVLILTFVGAMVGAVLGTAIMQRRAGPVAAQSPAPDRGPGNGKTEA